MPEAREPMADCEPCIHEREGTSPLGRFFFLTGLLCTACAAEEHAAWVESVRARLLAGLQAAVVIGPALLQPPPLELPDEWATPKHQCPRCLRQTYGPHCVWCELFTDAFRAPKTGLPPDAPQPPTQETADRMRKDADAIQTRESPADASQRSWGRTVTDLIGFLRDRLAEDEAIALGCTSRTWVAHDATVRGGPWVETADPGPRMSRMVGEPFPDRVGHMLPLGPRPADWWTMVSLHGTTGKFESEMRNAEHIARHDPARVLTEVAAKRAVIAHLAAPRSAVAGQAGRPDFADGWAIAADMTLRLLAAPHADHPDYRQEWAL